MTRRALRILALILAAAVLPAGCGKKGSPLPPLKIRPGAPTDFAARQRGEIVLISVTIPEVRTDETPLSEDSRLRLILAPERTAPPARGRARVSQRSAPAEGAASWLFERKEWERYRKGRSLEIPIPVAEIRAALQGREGSAAGLKIGFVAEVLEGKRGRSAPTDAAPFRACVPPKAPRDVRAAVVREGVLVEWGPTDEALPGLKAHVYRAKQEAGSATKPLAVIAGGANRYLDASAVSGAAFEYVVRYGAGEEPLACESEASEVASAVVVDRFAPEPPRDLAAAAESALIRLFWSPGGDSDLLGYHVYRAKKADGVFERLTAEPIPGTSYADETAEAGTRYLYAVSAVDRSAPPNESAPSAAVEEGLP